MKIVKSRNDCLVKYVEGRTVLDIGSCGMGEDDTHGGRNWIHGKIKKVAKKVVGIDIQRTEIKRLRRVGFDIRFQNAEEPFDLGEKFDVVVAEELIEHLQDLKTFFANVNQHLNDDGFLVITTPNPQAFEFFLQVLFSGKSLINPTHTHWQDKTTMEYLLAMNGFELVEHFFIEEWGHNVRGRVFQVLFKWLPQRFARNGIYIARKKIKM